MSDSARLGKGLANDLEIGRGEGSFVPGTADERGAPYPGRDSRRSPKGGSSLPNAEGGERHLIRLPFLFMVREPAHLAGGTKERTNSFSPPQGICRG